MALIIWDHVPAGPAVVEGRGIGIAAGIKLVPLIFIPYLLLTRRFRQAAVARGRSPPTVLWASSCCPPIPASGGWAGFSRRAAGPGSSAGGNQSLQAIITRLAGSVAARRSRPGWRPRPSR